jgi:hypothetical protein
MKTLNEPRLVTLFGVLLLVFLAYQPAFAEAKQTSLDSRIFQTFEQIDVRTNAHEQDVAMTRARLDRLASEMGKLRQELSRLTSEESQGQSRARKRRLHAEMVSKSAEYLSLAYKLVDSAAEVISANLSDLASLANEVRKSGQGSAGAIKLKSRIQENISAGKSMRDALVQIRNWAAQDPGLTSKFQSLVRISRALDKRISVDRARIVSRNGTMTGMVRNKRLKALNDTVDRLSDMYTEVVAEKEALKDLRDEVAMSIQLGRLEMTQEVAARAIPNVPSSSAPTKGVQTLRDMASAIAELNDSIVNESPVPGPNINPVTGAPNPLQIEAFQNF